MEPRYEGVQVRSTPRKMIRALNAFSATRENLGLKFYLGAVRYTPDLAQIITNELERIGPVAIGKGEDRVTSLLWKRMAFQHEAEVRIICLAPAVKSELFYVDVKPNEIFDEVQFDPRLRSFEVTAHPRFTRY